LTATLARGGYCAQPRSRCRAACHSARAAKMRRGGGVQAEQNRTQAQNNSSRKQQITKHRTPNAEEGGRERSKTYVISRHRNGDTRFLFVTATLSMSHCDSWRYPGQEIPLAQVLVCTASRRSSHYSGYPSHTSTARAPLTIAIPRRHMARKQQGNQLLPGQAMLHCAALRSIRALEGAIQFPRVR
jgi:hypothetical protein